MQRGQVIGGRYQLLHIAGEGGMATVWYGMSKSSEIFARPVAIKAMKRAFSGAQPHLAMFLEEARIGAELQHAHLVQVLDFIAEQEGGGIICCLVMEWIEGIDLRTMIKTMARLERPLPWGLVVHVGIGVLRGLAAAHERVLADGTPAPIVHRDVSPQNILLGLNGGVKLSDFGMARARDRASRLTAPGIVKGTVAYLPPEMIDIRGVATPRSDLYSLACTLWEALAGERLFEGAHDGETIAMIKRGQTRPLDDHRPDLPARLVAAIHKALSLDPKDRFPTARLMIQELGEILRESGPWIDSDVIIGTTVAQTREAVARLAQG